MSTEALLPLFQPFVASNITVPHTTLVEASYNFLKANTLQSTVNHCIRSAVFALLLAKRLPNFASLKLDAETIVVSVLLHDMGWATNPSLLSKDTRFEVDGANIARTFLRKTSSSQTSDSGPNSKKGKPWDENRLQLVWDTIALHTIPSIAHHKQPEVAVAQMGILADFLGPYFPPGNTQAGSVIPVDAFKEIVGRFPRAGFSGDLINTMCGLCRDKPETVYDNFVGEFGVVYGLDGKGGGKEEFAKVYEERHQVMPMLLGGLNRTEEWGK